jgi:hypothetical protein
LGVYRRSALRSSGFARSKRPQQESADEKKRTRPKANALFSIPGAIDPITPARSSFR